MYQIPAFPQGSPFSMPPIPAAPKIPIPAWLHRQHWNRSPLHTMHPVLLPGDWNPSARRVYAPPEQVRLGATDAPVHAVAVPLRFFDARPEPPQSGWPSLECSLALGHMPRSLPADPDELTYRGVIFRIVPSRYLSAGTETSPSSHCILGSQTSRKYDPTCRYPCTTSNVHTCSVEMEPADHEGGKLSLVGRALASLRTAGRI